MLDKAKVQALLDRFPGPVTVTVSIPKYLTYFAVACVFVAGNIALVFSQGIAADATGPHTPARYRALLDLFVSLHVARDPSQALVGVLWIGIALFGLAALANLFKLALSLTGRWGLTLDREGFTVKAPRSSTHYRWLDVGDFESLRLPRAMWRRRGIPLTRQFVIFNDYRAPETPLEWLRTIGRNRTLVEAYEYSAGDLAMAMSIWRAYALEDDTSRDR